MCFTISSSCLRRPMCPLSDVMQELERRKGVSGLAEKAGAGKKHLMETLARAVSPFRRFDRDEWSKLRADTPMTLTQD